MSKLSLCFSASSFQTIQRAKEIQAFEEPGLGTRTSLQAARRKPAAEWEREAPEEAGTLIIIGISMEVKLKLRLQKPEKCGGPQWGMRRGQGWARVTMPMKQAAII